MKKTIFFFILIAFAFSPFSGHANKNDTLYVDDSNNLVEKEKAKYYIIKEPIGKTKNKITFRQKKFYLSGCLFEEVTAYTVTNKDGPSKRAYREGLSTEYYPTGEKKSTYNYSKGEKKGDYEEYYINGSIKFKGRIDNFNKVYIYFENDSSGKPVIINGNGSNCEYNHEYNCICYTEVHDSLITLSYFIDEDLKDTIYYLIDAPIEPIGGFDVFLKKLSEMNLKSHINKPVRLKFKFIVFEDGTIGKIQCLNYSSTTLIDEIMNNIKTTEFQKPTLKNGKPIKVAFFIPIFVTF